MSGLQLIYKYITWLAQLAHKTDTCTHTLYMSNAWIQCTCIQYTCTSTCIHGHVYTCTMYIEGEIEQRKDTHEPEKLHTYICEVYSNNIFISHIFELPQLGPKPMAPLLLYTRQMLYQLSY